MKTKYLTPLDIPAAEVGGYAIKRTVEPSSTKMMLNSPRTSFFGQRPQPPMVYDHPTTWHQLLYGGVRIMSDWPIEQRQIDQSLNGFRGRVLVGGLGLGYAATVLLRRRTITEVVVVEIAAEVIELVKPFTRDPGHKLTVVHADLLGWLGSYSGQPFDHAFYDIWSSDGEGTFHDVVVPLYQLSERKVRHPPVWHQGTLVQLVRAVLPVAEGDTAQ